MSDVKQVKVDNWGIYFLQRLKHFFNRTDYCDLTLQFQDNAQLKVHRLVLNACTEYFELLERTCEMYEDCLVMPEDLQADVVVPIVNFMYTGQLEFRMDALERLYQTSQIMSMPVLSKLLDAHRGNHSKSSHNFGSAIRKYPKSGEIPRNSKYATSTPSSSGKRSYSKAFENNASTSTKGSEQRRTTTNVKNASNTNNELIVYRDKKLYTPQNKQRSKSSERLPSPIPLNTSLYNKKLVLGEPRPTRYELPEELDTDNIFDNSFTNISYTSKPLMVHPDTTKQYSSRKGFNAFNEPTSSKKSFANTVDIVECKKISKNDSIFDEDLSQNATDEDLYQSAFLSVKDSSPKDPSQLFDQILDNNDGPKVTIESDSKDKQTSNLDHAKIISEVLKRYPHLVKSNKNIKLKILNTPPKGRKSRPPTVHVEEMKEIKEIIKEKPKEVKTESNFTYETDVLNSKEAAKLISLGAENIQGPWICLICGTPGRALNFTTYYNFRRHLVEVHKEKPVSNICEHCGLKSYKRNYLLHHIYTKHGVPPPPQYHFPKCPMCDYIALTEGFLVKHKLTHSETKVRCVVCCQIFPSASQLLSHIQKTGHKQHFPDRKQSIQCTYCMKVFLRDNNFYCHLRTAHKEQALRDGVIEDSDDEKQEQKPRDIHELKSKIKHEHTIFENELEDEMPLEYEIPKRHENIHASKKQRVALPSAQKILNTGYSTQAAKHTQKAKIVTDVSAEFMQEIENPSQSHEGNVVVINDIEYLMKDNQLIPRKQNMKQTTNEEFILSDFIHGADENVHRLQNLENVTPTTSMEITNMHSAEIVQQPKMVLKKSAALNQPIQIVVSNEEEYKALMASNHSIIFDDGDPNKTLTVLTAPQDASLDTAGIDLDNTQSNDMMIIQEDYPLNVSEAVSADNSKYVVVYSHAMDHGGPNKQYQIIASQDIGAEYVQNSAVLTQNYDTITTSTSVISADVIDPPIDQSWSQTDQHDNQAAIIVGPETELQTITETEDSSMKENDDDSTLVQLPDAEVLRIPSKSTLMQLQQQCNINQGDRVNLQTLTSIDSDHMVSEESQSIEESMNISIPEEATLDKESTIVDETQITAEHEIEAECQEEISVDKITEEPSEISLPEQEPLEVTTNQEQPAEPLLPQEQHVESPIQEPPETSLPTEGSEINVKESNTDSTVVDGTINMENIEHDASNNMNEISETQECVPVEVQIPAESIHEPDVETRNQIQNLASEWSEDEYDNILEGPENSDNNIITKNKSPVTDQPELEESIENIQQEVQKQISDANISELGTEVENIIPKDTPVTENTVPLQTSEVIINNEATQEKISSLLNDWEDNSSQEDNSSINENGDDNPATMESVGVNESGPNEAADNEQNNTTKADKGETKKDDNIKSLVSDWDDDEEENKE